MQKAVTFRLFFITWITFEAFDKQLVKTLIKSAIKNKFRQYKFLQNEDNNITI